MYKSTLTPDEADRIVTIVEQILSSPKLPYGYRLSELQGYSRIDVAHALMISIAQVLQKAKSIPDMKSKLTKLAEAMDSSLIHIAMRGIPDNELDRLKNKNNTIAIIGLTGKWSLIPQPGKAEYDSSIKEERSIFGNLEMPSSIAEFCSIELESDDPDYWPKVYSRIGLEYPRYYFETLKKKTVNEIINNSSIEKPSRKLYSLPKSVEDQPALPLEPIIDRESLLKATTEIANEKGFTAKESFGKGRSLFIANNITLEDIENAMSPKIVKPNNNQKHNQSILTEVPNQNPPVPTLPKIKVNVDTRAWQVKACYTFGLLLYGIILYARFPYLNWGPSDPFATLAIFIISAYLGMFAFKQLGCFLFLCLMSLGWIGIAIIQNLRMVFLMIPLVTLSLTVYVIFKKFNGITSEWDELSD